MTQPPSHHPPVMPGHDQSPRPVGFTSTPPAPAKSKTVPILIGVLIGAVLGGAGGWIAGKSATPEEVAAEPAGVVTTAPSTAAAPTVSTRPVEAGTKVLKLGQVHSFTADPDKVAVTALAHKTRDSNEGVQVRTCNTGATTFSASTIPWLLSYSHGEELIDVTVEGGGLLSPAFVERDLAPGKCVKGWITFEHPTGEGKPDGVEYRIDGTTSARWEW